MLSKRQETARTAITLIGLLVSVYLATYSALNLPLSCPQGQIINCDRVLASIYAKTFGIPNALFGVLFFVLVLALARMKKPLLLLALNTVGMGFVLYYIYSEYEIGSVCIYCTVVHVLTIALFALSLIEVEDGEITMRRFLEELKIDK